MSTTPHSSDLKGLDSLQGSWWLMSREDRTSDGELRVDPILGPNPLGILSYAKSHFAAQFMKRDRTDVQDTAPAYAGKNNTVALGGYDAYFGTYEVNPDTGQVAHTLLGSINPDNVGMTVFRNLEIADDNLKIQLETTNEAGETITRTLTWQRIS